MSFTDSIRETIHAAVAAGAMASCKHREGPDPVEVAAELPGTRCKHPGQMKARTCAVAHCPIAARLAPQLAENLGAQIADAALGKVGLAAGSIRNGVSSLVGGLLNRRRAEPGTGGVEVG